MKINKIITVVFIFLFVSCVAKSKNDQKINENINSKEKNKQYTQDQLTLFVDSISTLNTDRWVNNITHFSDSIFNSNISVNIELSNLEFNELRENSKKGFLKINFIEKIFPNCRIDSEYFAEDVKIGNLPITLYSFDNNKNDFKNYAIILGYSNGYRWEDKIYFFYRNKLISINNVYHRYGISLNFYKDNANNTVIYYSHNYASGTGIFWNNFYFYIYEKDKLKPVLNELNDLYEFYPLGRTRKFESKIISTNPLTFKIIYTLELLDTLNNGELTNIYTDSTNIIYQWNDTLNCYKSDYFQSKLNKNKILSYYLDDAAELLYINSHALILKDIIFGNDKLKKRLMLEYLSRVKNRIGKRNL